MKRKNLIKLSKFRILFFGISILLFNCEKNEEFITQRENQVNKNFKFQKNSFNELVNNNKFRKAFEKTIKPKNTTYSRKSSKKDIYEFSIDSSTINQLEHKSITFYTMLIKREKGSTNSSRIYLLKLTLLKILVPIFLNTLLIKKLNL